MSRDSAPDDPGVPSMGPRASFNQLGDVHGGSPVQARRIGAVTINQHTTLPVTELDELTDKLAQAMHAQWQAAAADRRLLQPAALPIRWRRCAEPVAGPPSAAGVPDDGDAPFDPLPGLDHATSLGLVEGERRDLHRVYGGLPCGRLLLVGGPGSGKSSAAILLLLDALRYRLQAAVEDRHHIPVPVLFTLSGWDPDATPVRDWLISKLTTDIRLFRGRRGAQRATELVQAGRIAVFLDGLDEIPEPLRPRALQALSEQATCRLVLLTRTRELAAAAAHHVLVGALALELLPLQPADAADYLLRPLTEPAPAAWQAVTTALNTTPDSPVGKALTTPLAVGLLRDIYTPTGPVDELLDSDRFPTPDAITDHLLDHAITAAYLPRPGQPRPRYAADTAHRTLTLIALHLRDTETRDLAWWAVPTWVPRGPRTLVSALLGAVVIGLAGVLLSAFLDGDTPVVGLMIWFLLGFAGGFMSALDDGLGVIMATRWSEVRRPRTLGFALYWAVAGGLAGMLVGHLVGGVVLGVAVGLVLGFQVGLFSDNAPQTHRPKDLWRFDVVPALVLGLAAGFALVLVVGRVAWGAAGVACSLLMTSATFMNTEAWRSIVSQIYLRIRYGTPLRLGRFLEDARSRHLLRTVGPIYQFRHATLQDRLASAP